MNKHRATVLRPRYGRLVLVAAAVVVTAVSLAGGVTGIGEDPAVARDDAPTSIGSGADRARARAAATAAAADASPRVLEGTTLRPDTQVPAGSGDGRRIVFSETLQRVWLIDQDETVERTYLVSGSVTDNLDPGSYAVFSRSEQAYGIDDSGTMKYFVRFTRGVNAAIGFHDIPIDDGQLVQTRAQLGTPLSHGCVRQNRPDAIALWDFAPVGTPVVVTT